MNQSPGIFIEDFSRDETRDRHYAVLGRAVWLATRFENYCKTAAIMLGIKGGRLHAEAITTGEDYIEALEAFVRDQRAKQLNSAVQSVASQLVFEKDAQVLHEARRARNEIAHELASSFDFVIEQPDELRKRSGYIREAVTKVAEGDRLASVLLSRLNGDPILAGDSFANYVSEIVHWVCEVDPY